MNKQRSSLLKTRFRKPDLENHISNFLFLHIGVSYFVLRFKDSHQTISHL